MKDPFLKIWDHGVLNQISNRVEVSATNRISSCPSPPPPPFGSIRVAHYHHSDAKCCSPLEKRKPQEDEQRVCVFWNAMCVNPNNCGEIFQFYTSDSSLY